jgi:outer membrane lipoprotein SlyB
MTSGSLHSFFAGSMALAALGMSVSANAIEAGKAAAAATPAVAVQDSGDNGARKSGFLGGIFNCNASGSKQEIGAIAGGVLGGFLGNRIAGSGSRTLGTILGGALGAAAGSALGCKLQKNDQVKAQRAIEAAVVSGKDQSWKSDETGASGTVQVSKTANGTTLDGIKFADGVEPATGYTRVGGTYVTASNANVRAAPAASAKLLGTLPSGQRVWVPASVSGQPWMLVSQDGVGQGYVSAPLLKRSAAQTASGCKMVKQTVDVPGSGAQSETYQACKGKDGQWAMTRV